MTHGQVPFDQALAVFNDELVASPISIMYTENKPLTIEDTPLSRASRAVKRSYSERSDDDDHVGDELQVDVCKSLRQSAAGPTVFRDHMQPRSDCSTQVQVQVQQLLASSRGVVLGARKRVCVSAH